jgi:hypothetical protein
MLALPSALDQDQALHVRRASAAGEVDLDDRQAAYRPADGSCCESRFVAPVAPMIDNRPQADSTPQNGALMNMMNNGRLEAAGASPPDKR